MNDSLTIGLSSWIIQDGNYVDFKRGDQASFALKFAPTKLALTDDQNHELVMDHLHDSTYRIVAKVIHIREIEWWAIDAGIRMYRSGRPPPGIAEGSWIRGQAYIGVDPFDYLDRHSRHHTAPGLIYDWLIHKIEIDAAPFMEVEPGHRVRDYRSPGRREIDATHAGHDGIADYVLHCERLDNPPRR